MYYLGKMEVKINTLTPLWTGGVETGKVDRIHETGILGSLRWWMEVLVRGLGGQVKDPTSSDRSGLKPTFSAEKYRQKNEVERRQYLSESGLCDVSQIFGATGWKRQFRLSVCVDEPQNQPVWQPSVPLKVTPPDRTRGWYINPGWLGTLKITIQGDPKILAIVHALLRFIETWGSLGARPQLGYGIFRIINVDLENDHVKNALSSFSWQKYGEQSVSEQPDLRTFTFFKLRFTPTTSNWWHNIPGIKELRTRRDSWTELDQLAKQGMVPITPALKNHLRFHHQWSSPALPHWLFGTIGRGDERVRSKVAFSWAYCLDNSNQWEFRGWMYLPQDHDGRRFKDEVFSVFKDQLAQPQHWLTALGLRATDYRTAKLIFLPTETPWPIHKIPEIQTFLQTTLAREQV